MVWAQDPTLVCCTTSSYTNGVSDRDERNVAEGPSLTENATATNVRLRKIWRGYI